MPKSKYNRRTRKALSTAVKKAVLAINKYPYIYCNLSQVRAASMFSDITGERFTGDMLRIAFNASDHERVNQNRTSAHKSDYIKSPCEVA